MGGLGPSVTISSHGGNAGNAVAALAQVFHPDPDFVTCWLFSMPSSPRPAGSTSRQRTVPGAVRLDRSRRLGPSPATSTAHGGRRLYIPNIVPDACGDNRADRAPRCLRGEDPSLRQCVLPADAPTLSSNVRFLLAFTGTQARSSPPRSSLKVRAECRRARWQPMSALLRRWGMIRLPVKGPERAGR